MSTFLWLDRFPFEVFEKLPPARPLGGQVNSGGGHTVKLLRRDGSTRGFAGSPSRVEIPGCHAHTRAVFVIKNLTRRPFRSFLAILGIGIGVGAVVGLIRLVCGPVLLHREVAPERIQTPELKLTWLRVLTFSPS